MSIAGRRVPEKVSSCNSENVFIYNNSAKRPLSGAVFCGTGFGPGCMSRQIFGPAGYFKPGGDCSAFAWRCRSLGGGVYGLIRAGAGGRPVIFRTGAGQRHQLLRDAGCQRCDYGSPSIQRKAGLTYWTTAPFCARIEQAFIFILLSALYLWKWI